VWVPSSLLWAQKRSKRETNGDISNVSSLSLSLNLNQQMLKKTHFFLPCSSEPVSLRLLHSSHFSNGFISPQARFVDLCSPPLSDLCFDLTSRAFKIGSRARVHQLVEEHKEKNPPEPGARFRRVRDEQARKIGARRARS